MCINLRATVTPNQINTTVFLWKLELVDRSVFFSQFHCPFLVWISVDQVKDLVIAKAILVFASLQSLSMALSCSRSIISSARFDMICLLVL